MSDVGKVPAGSTRELMGSPLACILAAIGFAGMTTWGIYAMFSPALPILPACGDTLAVACLFVSKLAEIVLLATMLVRPSWVVEAVGGIAVPLAFLLFLPAFAIALLFWVVAALAGLAASFLAILWAMQRVEKRWETSTVQHMTVPVIVAALLLVPQLDQVGQMLCGAVATATFAYASLMKWTEMAVAGFEFQLHPVRRAASERLVQWAGFIAGGTLSFVAFHGEPVTQQVLYLIVCAIAVALVAAFALLGAAASPASGLASLADSGEEALTIEPPKNAAPFRDRCAVLIERYGLTEREGEVFVLLAKGRNTEHIQKKLFISGNTAKTHILHIYRKMGISSQQSLIDQVDKRNENPD